MSKCSYINEDHRSHWGNLQNGSRMVACIIVYIEEREIAQILYHSTVLRPAQQCKPPLGLGHQGVGKN